MPKGKPVKNPTRLCAECSAEFVRQNNRQKYCTVRCRETERQRTQADHLREVRAKYYQDNKEEIKRKAREYGRENWHWLKEKKKEAIARDPERYREYSRKSQNRPAGRQRKHDWYLGYYQENKESYYRRSATRRSRLAGAPQGVPYTRVSILERDNWMCALCLSSIPREERPHSRKFGTVDHIVPITRGGVNGAENAQAAHRGCNSRKHNRLHSELNLPFPPLMMELESAT